MPSTRPMPLLARLAAPVSTMLLTLSLAIPPAFAQAQTLPEIQRLVKQGQLPQALEKTELYIASNPKEPQGRFTKGLILTEMGRSADAIAMFTRLTEDFPELPEPYNNLAVLYAQAKQYDKARTALEMAIRTHPSYAIAHENLGDVYAKLASQAYDKALQLDTSNKSTQTKLSMIRELITTSGKSAQKGSPEPARPVAVEPSAAVKPPAPPTSAAVATPVVPAVVSSKPLEKPADTAPTKPPEPKDSEARPTPSPTESELTKQVQNWAAAWTRKDVKAYLAFYGADFQPPNGMSRKDWEAERKLRIDKPGKLSVTVEDIKVSLSGDTATVRFRQNYVSSTLKSSAGKTLIFVKSGNRWQIQQERVG